MKGPLLSNRNGNKIRPLILPGGELEKIAAGLWKKVCAGVIFQISEEQVRLINTNDKNHLQFLSHPPAGNQWQTVEKTFKVSEPRAACVTLPLFTMPPGAGRRYDDVKIEKLN